MHIKQLIVSTDEEGGVSECHWVAQLTPTEENYRSCFYEYVEAGMKAETACFMAFDELVTEYMHKFGDVSESEARAWVSARVDERLDRWLTHGRGAADEVVSA
jgi:hypothetical protein